MESTKLLYLEDFLSLNCEAKVMEVSQEEGRDIVILDQTILYPQGGGQPYDKGTIEGQSAKFNVDEVRYFDGIVKHIGKFENDTFDVGDEVKCTVDAERRKLNSREHSAGHLVDIAVQELDLDWIPDKGFHFPDGPYVEYQGNATEEQRESLKAQIEEICNKHIAEEIPVRAEFVDKEKLKEVCKNVPDNIPEGKPTRVVIFGNFAVPCGGTHVANLSELQHETIRKIKNEGENVRVAYDVQR